ncbi:GTP cyclohydrolase FolE2 [Tistrella mobilis]|uniref:GTP cyclohydrolase FolE2 n=1 Tax=Tistrella mobilis TaxID=171437 RepID=UPI0035571643
MSADHPFRAADTRLPDVSVTDRPDFPLPLRWVGFEGVDLPVVLPRHGRLPARAGARVDLPAPAVKGIHMSRLYRLLDGLTDGQPVTASRLRAVLEAMIASHQDCGTTAAGVTLDIGLPIRRAALVTEGLAGWRSYPVQIRANLRDGAFRIRMRVTVTYSSTCPCSAALARELVADGFAAAFDGDAVDPAAAAGWLRRHATLATPHAQRSEAEVEVDANLDDLMPEHLIDLVEQALGTPVQAAVRRADEQAFAALNGAGQMFVEDAARRLRAMLDGRYQAPSIRVRHLESLHPHDVVAVAD